MQINIDSEWKRTAFRTALFSIIGLYVGLISCELLADWLALRGGLGSLRAATRLVPGNADYRYRLGRYYELIARDEPAAINQFKIAATLNPHQARYWLDLANAYEV